MRRLRVLFVSMTNDVGSDRLIGDMRRAGGRCAVLAPPGAFATLVRSVMAHFPLQRGLGGIAAAFDLSRSLQSAVDVWCPDRVIPLDDLAATLLRTIGGDHQTPAPLRNLLIESFGAPAGYPAACQRVALMRVAEKVGVRIPAFSSSRDIGRPPFPLMVKRDQSSGSGGVLRVENEADLKKALRSARFKTAAKVGLMRVAGFRQALTPVLLQHVVAGRLAMQTVACRDGHVIDCIGFEAVEIHPQKRASTILRATIHAEMAESARRMVAALGCSGFVSFDFIVDAENRAFLIEMNPRPIGSTHLGRLFGHDLVRAFVRGQAQDGHTALLPPETAVALFPKELERDPASAYLAGSNPVVHDVPETEPAVLAAYLAHLKAVHPTRHAEIERHVPASRSVPARGLGFAGTTELC
ncbi:ATP-grasp domain-containing protein [Lichenifustis flavocetrariae]|uniref:ATP-grasp domain-containing protein n=1 Tax=Lichenifustis flavocetrariae TaxID=2949735 RepID=A0AA41Z281_9HYPH|nr:ATP-grasp domain-containing protein [Lichenifustis flavocetrariae]MCW6511632.1 ATP-grasp domain-containing protein [Lichenifustis flavocetrariae]